MLLMKLKPTLAGLLLVVLVVFAYGVVSLSARSDTGSSDRESPGPTPGFVPAPEGAVPPEKPVVVKAVYIVAKQGGDLSAEDLKRHPEVKTVHTFADLQRSTNNKVALWIDTTALPLLKGEKEMEWVIRRNVEGHPFAMVGCNEPLKAFRDMLDCFNISGPGPIDWTKYETSPGFSVIMQRREKVGKELHVTGPMRGYKTAPTVQKILAVTDAIMAGKAAPELP